MTETMHMMGAGQAARVEARAAALSRLDMRYQEIAMALVLWGRESGLTRRELAERTGIAINTINARVSEMRKLASTDKRRILTYGRRDKQSVVWLASLFPPAHE